VSGRLSNGDNPTKFGVSTKNIMKTATVQQGYKLQYWTPNSTNK